MPLLTHASDHHESDSEEDLDYVPEGEEQDSDASEERGAKRPRVQSPPQDDPATAKSERQALWAKFQDSVNASSSSTPPETQSESKHMVKIEKRHRFAGEDVVEIVEVPEDSADAKRWPLWKPPDETDGRDEAAADAPKNGDSSSSNAPIPVKDSEALPPSSSSSSSPTATATAQPQSNPQTQTTTTTKRPGRRKPKTQLAELPSASDSHKGKKLTTLEKSALDWKAHVHSSGAADSELASELEANRRGGGGYLEKVEFLQRVGDRKNEALDANRDLKRRRG